MLSIGERQTLLLLLLLHPTSTFILLKLIVRVIVIVSVIVYRAAPFFGECKVAEKMAGNGRMTDHN